MEITFTEKIKYLIYEMKDYPEYDYFYFNSSEGKLVPLTLEIAKQFKSIFGEDTLFKYVRVGEEIEKCDCCPCCGCTC